MSVLAKVKTLFFQHRVKGEDGNEGTAFPFWYVAVKGGGLLRRPVMVSHGIRFSREAAEKHLQNKKHRYAKTAFVYCDSAQDSWAGLRALYEILDAEDEGDAYQKLLGQIADAAGVTGSPTFDEVAQRVQKAREVAERLGRSGDSSTAYAAHAILEAFQGREA